MSVHINDIYESSLTLLPWITFLIGLSGSLHCAGMCGGLVMASCPTPKHNIFYQLGRLLAYSILGFIASHLGKFLVINKSNILISILPALAIGVSLIFIGVSNFNGKKPEIPMPKFFKNFLIKFWKKLLPSAKNSTILGPAILGGISILLPCGLLYAVALALAAFQNPFIGMIAMATFWIGTLPAMAFAPTLIRKFLKPIATKLPKLSAISLVGIGIVTISYRMYGLYFTGTCH